MKAGERLCVRECSDRTRGNGFNLKGGRFRLDIRKHLGAAISPRVLASPRWKSSFTGETEGMDTGVWKATLGLSGGTFSSEALAVKPNCLNLFGWRRKEKKKKAVNLLLKLNTLNLHLGCIKYSTSSQLPVQISNNCFFVLCFLPSQGPTGNLLLQGNLPCLPQN